MEMRILARRYTGGTSIFPSLDRRYRKIFFFFFSFSREPNAQQDNLYRVEKTRKRDNRGGRYETVIVSILDVAATYSRTSSFYFPSQ